MLTVFSSMITHQQNRREEHVSCSVLRKVVVILWLCFSLKRRERCPAADGSSFVCYFQPMMWRAVGQTKPDMLFKALQKQSQRMSEHKRHVFH